MDCTNLLTVVVSAILALAIDTIPATEANILTRSQALCPATTITLADIQTAIGNGTRCGVLLACIDEAMNLVYIIRNEMLEMKPSNLVYYRIVNPLYTGVTPCVPLVEETTP